MLEFVGGRDGQKGGTMMNVGKPDEGCLYRENTGRPGLVALVRSALEVLIR